MRELFAMSSDAPTGVHFSMDEFEHILANCQPFTHELGGRIHVFAHNGDLETARHLEPFAMTWTHMAIKLGYGRSFAFARLQR